MAQIKSLRELENSEVEGGKVGYQLDFTIDVDGVEDDVFMQNVYLNPKKADEEAQAYVEQYETDYKAARKAKEKEAEE